jgi:hypothetical protein
MKLTYKKISVLMTLIMSLFYTLPANASFSEKELKLKVAFLYQFAKYSTWPEGITAGLDKVNLCFLGSHPFSPYLKTIEKKEVAGKSLSFIELSSINEANQCQLIYFAPEKITELQAIKSKPIVTVSESENFIEQGGLINLVRKGTKQKFEVNGQAQQQADISFSSKLLKIGIIVN